MSEAPTWRIRRALPNEAANLSQLTMRSKAYWGYPDQFMLACRQELALDQAYIENNSVYVLEYAGCVIGFYGLEHTTVAETELGFLFVEPDFIGKGYGRELLTHAKQQAAGLGYGKIIIQGDPHAERFYRAAGGTQVGFRESASIPDRKLPLFRIELKRAGMHIRRGDEYNYDPCRQIANLAVRLYGPQSALPVPLLQEWYCKNPAIFRIAGSSDGGLAGYISALPLCKRKFEQTIKPDFQEKSIQAKDVESTFGPENGGVFLSSIVVAPEYQQQSPASLLLRIALVEDLIAASHRKGIRISAQAISRKGQVCMESLGMKNYGATTTGWKIYYGELGIVDLRSIQEKLNHKLITRFEI